MKTPHSTLALLGAGFLMLTGCASMPEKGPAATHVYRVPCRVKSDSHDLQIFIATGSKGHPIVTIADNEGYPTIKDFYARPASMQGKDGVWVTIRFEAPARGKEISLNVLQEGMRQDFQVMPFQRP